MSNDQGSLRILLRIQLTYFFRVNHPIHRIPVQACLTRCLWHVSPSVPVRVFQLPYSNFASSDQYRSSVYTNIVHTDQIHPICLLKTLKSFTGAFDTRPCELNLFPSGVSVSYQFDLRNSPDSRCLQTLFHVVYSVGLLLEITLTLYVIKVISTYTLCIHFTGLLVLFWVYMSIINFFWYIYSFIHNIVSTFESSVGLVATRRLFIYLGI